jgi:FkbM family methyltransferase
MSTDFTPSPMARHAQSNIGTLEQEDGRQFIKTHKSDLGCLLYGPYQSLGKGRYSVKFDITPDEGADPGEVCCKIDVVSNQGRAKLLERMLSVRELRDTDSEIEVEFKVLDAGFFEYRVFATGTTGLRVGCDRKAKVILDATSDLSFLALADNASENRLFRDNYGAISRFCSQGVKFEVTKSSIIATANGVKFHIDSPEDLQLLWEIFYVNEYNFVPPRYCIAIDIGMNVGMASLALASNPKVERIYAFEPFKVPFTRAMQNFKLNPVLSRKIEAYNFGLSDKCEDLDVLSQEFKTISTSVRGNKSGMPEKIYVRDAGSELRNLIVDANSRGLGVVCKVDCEGSEFSIFEALEHADLFQGIDALMIEWHKWWSRDKTQHDLIRPLTKAGFFVFDRTDPSDPYAGFILAVNAMDAAKSLAQAVDVGGVSAMLAAANDSVTTNAPRSCVRHQMRL